MAKDRLSDLLKAKNRKNGDVQIEMDAKANGATSSGKTLRQTFESSEVLRQWIETIEDNVATVKQYIHKLDDINTNQKDLNDKIESLFQNNTSVSQQISSKLKHVEEELNQVEETSAEGRIKNIQYNSLKTRFHKIFIQNNVELENFRNVKKSQLEAQLIAKGVRVTDEELVHLLEENADLQVFTDNILAETAEAKRVLRDLEERHQQLLKIERMLVEVKDLFVQMSILVDNQQELVDRIEYLGGVAQGAVRSGRTELNEGQKNRCKYLKRKLILIAVVVVLVAIILILIFK